LKQPALPGEAPQTKFINKKSQKYFKIHFCYLGGGGGGGPAPPRGGGGGGGGGGAWDVIRQDDAPTSQDDLNPSRGPAAEGLLPIILVAWLPYMDHFAHKASTILEQKQFDFFLLSEQCQG
jgi:hypothetical protein